MYLWMHGGYVWIHIETSQCQHRASAMNDEAWIHDDTTDTAYPSYPWYLISLRRILLSAISHILKNVNIRYQLRRLKDSSKADKARGKRRKGLAFGGNTKTVEPALKRMKNSARAQAAADESDEEEQRQLALGSAGL